MEQVDYHSKNPPEEANVSGSPKDPPSKSELLPPSNELPPHLPSISQESRRFRRDNSSSEASPSISRSRSPIEEIDPYSKVDLVTYSNR